MLEQLETADCISEISSSLTNFDNIFYVKLNTNDISNIDLSNVLFKINNNNNHFSNINFSNSSIKYGAENKIYANSQKIKFDMIRHISKDITGSYGMSDIFTNETSLKNDVVNLDNIIIQDISNILNEVSELTVNGISNETINNITNQSHLRFLKCVSKLFEITVKEILNNSSYNYRTLQFINNVNNSDINDYISFNFIEGDAAAFHIQYDPNNKYFISNNIIHSRIYKILISFI